MATINTHLSLEDAIEKHLSAATNAYWAAYLLDGDDYEVMLPLEESVAYWKEIKEALTNKF